MIKVISFDIGGTILYNKSLDDYNLKKLTELVNADYKLVRHVYKDVFQKSIGTFYELVSKFCNKLNIEMNDDILNFFENKFSNENNISVMDKNIINVMSDLKSMGYKIILFSNSCVLIKNKFSDGFLKYIDEIFYSYDIGFTKDDEESYKIVESKMDCLGSEILHIGDTLKSDYLKPREFGWNAYLYGKSDDKNIETIENLNEIIDLLGDLCKIYTLKKNKD